MTVLTLRHVLRATLVIVLLLALTRALPLLRVWNDGQRRLATRLIRDLAEARRSLARQDEIRRLAASQRDAVRSREHWLFAGQGRALSDAALARRIQQAADDAGAELMAIQSLKSDRLAGGLDALRARVSVAGDFDAVIYFLAAIENGPERIAVREMLLAQPEISIPPARVETIRAEFVVEGLANGDSTSGVRP